MKKFLALMTAVAFLFSVGSAMAAPKGAHKLSPKKRLKIQHERIKDGVKDGTITKDEHQKLAEEGKEINQERKADLAKDGGKLTKQDRHDLEKKLDSRSKEIYQDKHPDSQNNTNTNNGSVTGN